MTQTRTDNPIPLPPIPFTDGEYRWLVTPTTVKHFYYLRLQRYKKMRMGREKWITVVEDGFHHGHPTYPNSGMRYAHQALTEARTDRPNITGAYQPEAGK